MTQPSLLDLIRERLPVIIVAAATTAWLVIVVLYLSRLGIATILELPLGDFAALLVAVSAPVVGIWLVVAVLDQRAQLNDARRRLADVLAQSRQSLQHVEVQSRALIEVQAQLQRMLAAETRRLVLQDLASHAGVLAERLGILKGEAFDVAWARFGSGDMGAFVQPFLAYFQQHPDLAQRIGDAAAHDAAIRGALNGFVRSYDRLTSALDGDKLALGVIDEGVLGRGYRIFKAAISVSPQPGSDAVLD